MDDFDDVQWVCKDIQLQFSYVSDNLEMGTGTIIKDKEVIDIVCMFSLSKNIEIYDKLKYNSTTGDDVCDALLIGHYEIEGNVAKVTIVEDNLYEGNYLNKVIYLDRIPLK